MGKEEGRKEMVWGGGEAEEGRREGRWVKLSKVRTSLKEGGSRRARVGTGKNGC